MKKDLTLDCVFAKIKCLNCSYKMILESNGMELANDCEECGAEHWIEMKPKKDKRRKALGYYPHLVMNTKTIRD